MYHSGERPEYEKDKRNPFVREQVVEKDVVYLSGEVAYIREKDGFEGRYYEVTVKNVFYYNKIKSKQTMGNVREKIKITKIGESILCSFDLKNNMKMGQTIFFRGNLAYFTKARNPGEFDQSLFYQCRGVLFSVRNSDIISKSKSYHRIKQFLYFTRMKNEGIFKEYLALEDAAIMKAMLLGEKDEIDTETKNLFQKNGIAHILAISGLHISFIGMTLFKLLQKLPIPRFLTFMLSELTIILYVIMVGFSPSSFRALCMFSLFLLSKVLKRSYDMITALATAGMLILFWQPLYLFDCAFLLSFFAIIGIGIFYQRIISVIYQPPNVARSFFASFFVFFSTLPIILYFYFEASFLSVLLNLIVIPLMSILLVSGIILIFLNGVGSLCFLPTKIVSIFCYIPAKIVSFILWIYKECCIFLEHFNMGRYNIGRPTPIQIILFYVLFILSCYLPCKKKKTVFSVFVMLACFALFFRVQSGMDIYTLDVGQGDCSIIVNENRNVYLFDSGSSSKNAVGEKRVIPFLKSKGVGIIEAVFISHPDLDHMNGIEEILSNAKKEKIFIKTIYILNGMEKEYDTIVTLAKGCDTKIVGIQKGFKMIDEELVISCMYPQISEDNKYYISNNDASLVMDISYRDFNMLFMGDIELQGESILLPSINQSYDALKVSHHGSNTSTSENFLRRANPQIAVISCGENNPYGHPHKEVIQRLKMANCRIVQTKESGCIRIHINRKGKKKVTGFL